MTDDDIRTDAAYCLDVIRREWTGSEKFSRMARVLPGLLTRLLDLLPARAEPTPHPNPWDNH